MKKRKAALLIIISSMLCLWGCGLAVETIAAGAIPDKTEKDRMIAIGGINYHYTEYPAKGQDIVLLHGFSSSTYTWEACAEILHRQGFHVWALDMKGFGWSDKPRGVKYDPFTLMEETGVWMKTVKITSAVVVGNSLGGAIAWGMAIAHPELVSRLVLIDAAGYRVKKPLIISIANAPFAAELTELFFGKWAVRTILSQVLYDSDRITEKQVDAYFDRQRTENGLYAQVQVARELDFEAVEQYTKRIPEIRQQTLIIWGRDDSWVPVDCARQFNRDIKNSRIAVIPECGHIGMEEKPGITAGLIADFIMNKPVDEKYAQ